MKKRLMKSLLLVSVFAFTLTGCGDETSGEVEKIVPFTAAQTTGSVNFAETDDGLEVYYINDMSQDIEFDLKDIAYRFSVGENDGRYESFKIIDDMLCYPNKGGADSALPEDYYWRPVLLTRASGQQIIELDEVWIAEYEKEITDFGVADISKIVIDGYFELELNIDFIANGGNHLGPVDAADYPNQ